MQVSGVYMATLCFFGNSLNSCCLQITTVPTTHLYYTCCLPPFRCYPPGFCSLQPRFRLTFLQVVLSIQCKLSAVKKSQDHGAIRTKVKKEIKPVFSVTSCFLAQRNEAYLCSQFHRTNGIPVGCPVVFHRWSTGNG